MFDTWTLAVLRAKNSSSAIFWFEYPATTWTSLHEIDPNTNRVVATTRLLTVPDPRGPAGLFVLGDSVWVGIEGP